MIKLIAFDWNGTLLADTAVTWRAENAALKKFQKNPISLKRFKETFDIPIIKLWRNVGLSENFLKYNLEKLENCFIKNHNAAENKSRFRANVRTCLAWLEKQNILTAVYSNAPNSHIEMHLKRLKVKHVFDGILGRPPKDFSHLTVRGKQQRLHEYTKLNKLNPKEIISVGDTEEEMEIGKALGYHTVAITGGYNTTARLKKHHPDFLIHNMRELIGIVKKLNKR